MLLGLNLFIAFWVQSNIHPHLPSDLAIYLQAGQKVLQHQNAYQPFEIGISFVYPPPALLLLAPLSTLNFAQEIWAALNLLSVLLVLAIHLKLVANALPQTAILWLTAGALLYIPLWEHVTIGQINALVLLGMVSFLLGVADPRYKHLGDFGLAVAILIKMSPLVLVAYPLIYRDWARCGRIALYGLGLVALSVLFFGLTPWRDFLAILPLLPQGYPGTVNQALAPTFNWFMSYLVAGANFFWVGSVFSVGVLGLWVGVLFWQGHRPNPTALLNFGIVGLTISSSLIWYHHLVFLLAPLAFLLLSANPQQRQGQNILLLILLGVVLININRVLEIRLDLPPLASIAGYLAIYLASGLSLGLPASQPATQRLET